MGERFSAKPLAGKNWFGSARRSPNCNPRAPMILHTQRNRVITAQPDPDEAFFFITLLAPAFREDLSNPRVQSPSVLPLRPVNEYQ